VTVLSERPQTRFVLPETLSAGEPPEAGAWHATAYGCW
jgi:hypothetical protein